MLFCLQASPYVQYALALSTCLMTCNWVAYARLLEGAPLLLAAAAQVRHSRGWAVCVGGRPVLMSWG